MADRTPSAASPRADQPPPPRPEDRRPRPKASAATTASRDLGLILRNRNDQLVALAQKHREKETALLRVCDAVTLAEAKRIAGGALDAR